MGAVAYEQKQHDRELAYLKKKAANLGFILVEHDLAPVAVAMSGAN